MNWGWRAGMQGFNERPPPIPFVAERLEDDIDGFGWMNRRPAPIVNAPRWFDLLDDERKAEEERKVAERAEEERKRSMYEKLNTIQSFILNSRFFDQPVKRMQIYKLAEEQEMKEYWKNYENYPEIQHFIELQIETLRTGGQKRKMRRKRISKKLRK